MKIVISDKAKKDIFTALFQTLKNCTNIICVIFYFCEAKGRAGILAASRPAGLPPTKHSAKLPPAI